MLEFMQSRFQSKKGLLIVNPWAVFSLNVGSVAQRLCADNKYKLKFNLDYIETNEHQVLPESTIQRLKAGEYKYMFFSQYADESHKLLQQLQERGIDIPIVSTTSWTTADIELLRRHITHRKSEIYSAATWLQGSPDSIAFERLAKKVYGREPTAEMAQGYDLGLIVAQTLNALKEEPTKENILKTFLRLRCFRRLTVGELCFPAGGGHANGKIHFVRFSEDRFVLVTN